MDVVAAPHIEPAPSHGLAGRRVRCAGVRKTFDTGVVALGGIDLDVAAGEFVALLGPSGCGKSTLLRLIAGLAAPDAGEIEVERASSADESARSQVAFVFQDAHLLPWRTVLRNVALPLELRAGTDAGWLGRLKSAFSRAERREHEERARAALRQVGLADADRLFPAQLSGGMRMRVSLARALVTRPRLLLLDEPFAALDQITRQRLDEQLRRLWSDSGMTVLFVTHSISEAVFLADRAVVLSRRPARVILDRRIELPRERTPELRLAPEFNEQSRELFNVMRAEDDAAV